MFGKRKNGGNAHVKDVETIIGSSVKVEGDFTCEGNMVIDGEIKGYIKTKGFLRVGPKSIIVADIEASASRISGTVRGNVKVDDFLEITSTAKIFGNLEAARLSVAEGAWLNGKCTMVLGKGKTKGKKEEDIEVAETPVSETK